MQKTLYVSDLDGTLLTPEECLTPFAAETIRHLTAEGMLFSYATARSFSTARKVTGALGALHLPVIVNNGGAILDAADGHILEAVYFTEEETAFVRTVLAEAGLSPIVYSRNGDHPDSECVSYIPRNISRGMAYYLNRRKDDERLCQVEEDQLYCGRIFYFAVMKDSKEECEAAFTRIAADERFSTYLYKDVYSEGWYFEIGPARATKANAVQRLAELYGCAKIVCFGDGKNDMPMFSAADESYAMGNADESLKAAATAVIGTNREDGVAHKLIELWQEEKRESK